MCGQRHSSPQTEKRTKETAVLIQGLESVQVMRHKQCGKGQEDIAKGWAELLNSMCKIGWVMGCPNIWLKYYSGCACEGVFG